jgi:hypothetical protein
MIELAFLVGQAASHTIDPPTYEPPGLALPALVIAVIIALVVAVAALLRSRKSED